MRFPVEGHRFLAFLPPYRRIDVLDHPYQIPRGPLPNRGSVLIWNLGIGELTSGIRSVRTRPPGVALFIILPPSAEMASNDILLRLMSSCRPHSVLPQIDEADTEELVAVLRRFPGQFDQQVAEYLVWRGINVDLDTRRLIRKTLNLSNELRTVSGLARALYMSRRALGRRFMSRGLPVPSHWLHFGRVLRGSIQLQDPGSNLFSIGCDLGYSDGFAFSNQLKRLTGLRPSIMRECFGWEWIVEAWLWQEANTGGLSPDLRIALFPGDRGGAGTLEAASGTDHYGREQTMRVAEDPPNPSRADTVRSPRAGVCDKPPGTL